MYWLLCIYVHKYKIIQAINDTQYEVQSSEMDKVYNVHILSGNCAKLYTTLSGANMCISLSPYAEVHMCGLCSRALV